MRNMLKRVRLLGILILAACLVVPISGCTGQALALEGAIEGLNLNPDGITIVVDGQEIVIDSDTEIAGMLAEGTVIEAKFIVQDDGSLLALEIEVEESDNEANLDDDGDIELKGTIQSIATDDNTGDITSIVIDGQEVLIDENTEIESTLAVGALVEVEYEVQDDGSLLAVEIEVEENEEDIEDGEEIELEGAIEDLTDTSITVAGQTFITTKDTEIEGVLALGAIVEIEYEEIDGSLIALEVEVEDREGDQESDTDEDADEDFELEGTIESLVLNPDGTSTLTITNHTQEIIINGDTEVEGVLTVGAIAEVEIAVQPDGSLVALEIEVEDDENEEEDENHEDEDDDEDNDHDDLDED